MVAFTTEIACLSAFINIGSSSALDYIISLTVGRLATDSSLRVPLHRGYCRGLGCEQPPYHDRQNAQIICDSLRIFRKLRIAVNVFGIVYIFIVLFFTFWSLKTVTAAVTIYHRPAVLWYVVHLRGRLHDPNASNVHGPVGSNEAVTLRFKGRNFGSPQPDFAMLY